MNAASGGFRVAVVGASSLLGKELLAVLKERNFPISRLVTPNVLGAQDPELPVLDLSDVLERVVAETDVGEADLDIVFLAAPLLSGNKKSRTETEESSFLQSPKRLAAAARCKVIDLSECLAGEAGGALSVPFLDRITAAHPEPETGTRFFIAPHPATIILSAILLRLSARFPIKSAVGQIFDPVSDIGSHAIDELQKQTMNLLTFQKIPQKVFGTQLAFNLLPRLGHPQGHRTNLARHVQKEMTELLSQRAPLPALRAVYGPVFHSLACSLYVELDQPATPETLSQLLAGAPITVRKSSEGPPSQVDVAGSDEIIVDALTADGAHAGGVWIWAAADNLRLAALNAVEIAESLSAKARV